MSSSSLTSESVLEKFEFYFIGLTFTLLGASIQTASFKGYSCLSVYLELLGWVFFIISGLIGLSKLEWISVMIYVKTRKSSLEEVAQQLRINGANALNADSGQIEAIGETLSRLDTLIGSSGSKLEKIGERHKWKHEIQKYFFAIGLIAIAIARGINAVQSVT